MYILGLNAYHADSSAALFHDGKLVAAIEEERFKRVKHWAGFPEESILYCLSEAGITLKEIDHIAIGRDPYAKLHKKLFFVLKHPIGIYKALKSRFNNARKVSSLEEEFHRMDNTVSKDQIKRKIHYIEHHRSHLASAFFASPFEESVLLSIDGSGDFSTTMTALGKGNKIQVLDSVDFPHSVGLFYTAFTQLLGFPHYGDEYKIMGLAPYGEPKYTKDLYDVLKFHSDGLFTLNPEYFQSPSKGIIYYGEDHIPVVAPLFSKKMASRFGPVRKSSESLTQYHKDLAASVQRITEELIYHILVHLHQTTKITNVCIAGGVAQNSVANGKISRNTPFTNVYIPSAGHDAGISMGAALYLHNHILHAPRQPAISSAFTGSHYSNEFIKAFLVSNNIDFIQYEDDVLFDMVADKIIDNGVVGWFNGRAEFGPRALGGRSILADPRNLHAKELLNSKIKRRESFRPFAPSILKEYVAEYFEVVDDVPFMEKVFPVKKGVRHLIPAVTHVDGTGRLQSVDKTTNPRYYQLIETFRIKTGIPILLNTSFNENEPIVNTPAEALNCFLRTSMDMLVLENCVILREN